MRLVTATIVLAVVVIAVVTALTLSGLGGGGQAQTPSPLTPITTEQPPTQPSGQVGAVQYDAQLAQKGVEYFRNVGCTACHSVRSLGISGGAVGPDLSKALFSNTQWLGRYYKENGLDNPASDPVKAAQLLAQYMINPPDYSTTMRSQTAAYKSLYGDQWEKDYVPALVEMMKMAASR
ncbi:Cytochrome c [Pyrobaculum oguniense TE7]|uniref:Cytochrome c n=2 Tax=Pyrobaculum oguniense TaxID=99007 RepID=H6Q9D4_PYROT|nr:Cytochrome c [Pyrobaculum oguniense TE7]BAC56135.1 cytochrome c [Pyrobaculum oguniense TE7]